MGLMLKSVADDNATVVRRQAGHVVCAIVAEIADNFSELATAWPEVLPAVAAFTGGDREVALRVVALGMLKDMIPTIGEGLLQQANTMAMLAAQLSDGAHEVRAAGAQLVLGMVATLATEDLEPLRQAPEVAAAVVKVIQGLANTLQERS
eukprot:SRR837773.8827.p1 GENE.SRR837773.8827~~SRR837773.8827.p1  ORF type:complete len:168 (+),score=69.56 SRR837773.8827:55-504(+)